jgi:hypothetical protein
MSEAGSCSEMGKPSWLSLADDCRNKPNQNGDDPDGYGEGYAEITGTTGVPGIVRRTPIPIVASEHVAPKIQIHQRREEQRHENPIRTFLH